jgi:hypothetical protein
LVSSYTVQYDSSAQMKKARPHGGNVQTKDSSRGAGALTRVHRYGA